MSFTYLFADTLILPKQNLRRIFEIMDNSRTGKKNLGTKTKQSWSSQRERGDMATDEGFQQKVKAEKEKYAQMSLDEKRKEYKCGPKFVTLNDIATWPEYALQKKKGTSCYLDSKCGFEVNDKLNRKISLFQGDITSLEIDAIVNAANESLMGGGGVDGAIHLAAGKFLKNECMTLGGCKTGDAKITSGYRLPAKHVIHTVGPIGENPEPLKSCYHTCLELLKKHSLKTVAFPCISTGIYGYPVLNASHVALKTIREWLEIESNAKNIQRIILCVFLSKDLEVYENLLPLYFPLGPRSHDENNGAYKIEEPDISESLNVSDHVSPQREVSPQRVQDKSTLKSQIPAFKHQVSAQAPKSQTSPKAGHTTKVSQALKSSAASTKTQPPAPTVSTKIQTSAPSVSIKTPASAPKSPKSEISRPQTSPPPSRSPPAPKPHSPPRPQSSSSNKSPQTKNKTGSAPVEMHAAPAPPQKAHDAPQKAHDAPQKAHDAPQKAHDTPQKAHDAPQKAHDTPQKAHDTPQRAHDTPQRAHDTPQRAQDASQRAHDAPQKTHDAPQRAHDAPQRAHDSPQRAHDSPQRAHDSPQKAQDKPSSRTPSPKPAQKFQKKADTPRQKETTRSLKSQPPRKIPVSDSGGNENASFLTMLLPVVTSPIGVLFLAVFSAVGSVFAINFFLSTTEWLGYTNLRPQ